MTRSTRNGFLNSRRITLSLATAMVLAGPFFTHAAQAQDALKTSIIPNEVSNSTVPTNGDVNPYGVVIVPANHAASGALHPGDILVSNFNNSGNLQGTGSTIVRFGTDGSTSVFYQGQGNLGLNAGLALLNHGFVIVGNVPTTDGTCATVQAGSLLILDKNGNFVTTFTDPVLLNGPWNLTVVPNANTPVVYVSNVLSGTITRLTLKLTTTSVTITQSVQIASGYMHGCTASTFVVGPAGLAYDAVHDRLYVASTADNEIFAVSSASKRTKDTGTGAVVYQDPTHLHGPIDLLIAPNGNLVTANGDGINVDANQPSEIVEFTPTGHFVSEFSVNPNGLGGAFGIAMEQSGSHVLLAASDDVLNELHLFTLNP